MTKIPALFHSDLNYTSQGMGTQAWLPPSRPTSPASYFSKILVLDPGYGPGPWTWTWQQYPPAPGCGNSGKGGASRIRDRGTHGYRGRMGSPNMIWTHGYRGWTQFFGADLARWVPKSMDATQNRKSGGLQISGKYSNIRDI